MTNPDENIIDSLFDPEISQILELLEHGPMQESQICEKLSITTNDLEEKLLPLIKNEFVIKSDTEYSANKQKLADVIESSGRFDNAIDKVTQMDSYLN